MSENVASINANTVVLTYENLNSRLFVAAVQKLASSKALPVATKIKVGELKEALFKASTDAQTEWKAKLDSEVEWEGEGDEKKPKDLEKYQAVEADFLKKEVAMGIKKFNAQNLKLALNDFTSDELCVLKPIIANFDQLAQEGEE